MTTAQLLKAARALTPAKRRQLVRALSLAPSTRSPVRGRGAWKAFWRVVGRFRDKRGATDVARRHDRYLEDAFAE